MTDPNDIGMYGGINFNPHEREARDASSLPASTSACNFNPHEREARDVRAAPRARRQSCHFNPHEREARDEPLLKARDENYQF